MLLLAVFPRACLADRCQPAPLALSQVEGPALSGAEGPAPSGASGSAAYVTFDLSPQPAGSRLPRRSLAGLREESTPRTRSAQPQRTLRADKNKPVRATREAGARIFALSNPNTRRLVWRAWPPSFWRQPASPTAGGPARQHCGGRDTFTGTENKPLTAISNRNSNDSRRRTTLSESTTSNFLIATKMHVSEEKAKSEEKTNLLKAPERNVLGMHLR
jgi:hypothetical protein